MPPATSSGRPCEYHRTRLSATLPLPSIRVFCRSFPCTHFSFLLARRSNSTMSSTQATQGTQQTQLPNLPNAGIPAPIPDDFDFKARMVIPDPVNNLLLPIVARNADNIKIEKHNLDSMTQTARCKADRINYPDVGAATKPYYAYSREEFRLFVASENVVTACGPIPFFVRLRVDTARADALALDKAALEERRKRKEEKEDATLKGKPLQGSLVPAATLEYDMFGQAKIPIPDAYMQGIKARQTPPLNFWTNRCITDVYRNPAALIVKDYKPTRTDTDYELKAVSIVNIEAMAKKWGSDSSHTCLSSFSDYVEALANIQRALDFLSKPSDPTNPNSFSLAEEFKKHVAYLSNLEEPSVSYPLWFSWERARANRLIVCGERFDLVDYKSDASYYNGEYRSKGVSSFAVKRPAPYGNADESRPFKSQRTQYSASTSSYPPRPDSYSSHSFRSSCSCCGGPHAFRQHPVGVTTFPDGKPLFSVFRSGFIWTAKPHGGNECKKICIFFNLPKGCNGVHPPGSDFLHICSLCGKDHNATTCSSRHA